MADVWDNFAPVPQQGGNPALTSAGTMFPGQAGGAAPAPAQPQSAGAPGAPVYALQDDSDVAALNGLQGQDYLTALQKSDPAGYQQVKAIGEGRAPYPTGFIMKTPFGRWLTGALGQAYPGMTAQDFATRTSTAKDFASGKSAQMVKAANQAILHAQTALEASKQLGGFNILPGVLNSIRNLYEGQTDPDYQAAKATYDAALNALAGELTKTFRGSAGAESDIMAWRKDASAADSPASREAAIRAGINLLHGALESLTDQYNRGMGANIAPRDLLAPRNKAAYENIMGVAPTGTTTAGFFGTTGVKPTLKSAPGTEAPAQAPKPGNYVYDPATRSLKPAQ